ncbi:MAG: MFS transporter [Alphaproteobacteria bacterium]|nr:MFS transporter [Alphaproteobacteria bacterium]
MTKYFRHTYSLKSLTMWMISCLFFMFQFIPRLWLGQNADHIREQLSIDWQCFGYISALYYFGYSGMQIPVAMMLDRFQPRYVISGLIALLSLSFLAFTLTDNWIVAAGARFFIGVGSAAGFLGVSKIISQWFDRKTYAKLLGVSIGFGILGAVYGGGPTYVLVQKYGVDTVAFGIVGVGLALALAVFFSVRSPANSHENNEKLTIAHLKELISSPTIWILGAVNLLLVGPLEGFADVWGGRYLVDIFGFKEKSALELVSFIFIGLISASPITPWIGKKIGDYALINVCGLGIVLCFVTLFMQWTTSWLGVATTLFMMGAFSSYQTNLLSAGSDMVRPVLIGVAVAFLNSWNMFGGSVFHPLVGGIMDSGKTGQSDVVSESTYIAALGTIPLAAMIGIILMCFIWISHHKHNRLK